MQRETPWWLTLTDNILYIEHCNLLNLSKFFTLIKIKMVTTFCIVSISFPSGKWKKIRTIHQYDILK